MSPPLLQPADATRVGLVVNTGSRRGQAGHDTAIEELRRLGVPLGDCRSVEGGEPFVEAVREVARDHDLVVVGGGDGSISCAAGVLAGTDAVLGVLPLGTANDFARTLQLPSRVEDACRVLTEGKVVDIDLGRVDGHAYLNVASLGLSVGVTSALTPRLKRRLGPLAYPVATVKAYRDLEPFTAWLDFPEGDHESVRLEDQLQVAVGNGRHYGGGNTVAPDAGIDDNQLDVYAIERGALRDHVSIARFLKSGHFVEHERVLHLTTTRLALRTDPEQPINLDGEVLTSTPSEFTLQRNGLHVVVPQDSEAATLDGPGSH